jgi:hypothetical protein
MNDFVREAVLNDDGARGVESLASALGWPCYVVDLHGCLDKATLLERCAAVLAFPSWFGHNWDAFFDSLIDLPSARRSGGCVLVFRGVAGLRAAAPEALDTALAIVADAAKVWAGRGVTMRAFVS